MSQIGFSPYVKKIVVKPKQINLVIVELTNFLKIKRFLKKKELHTIELWWIKSSS